MSRLFALFTLVALASGCWQPVAQRCKSCVIVDAARPALPQPKPRTHTVFVIVPGLLGYGWEWDEAAREVRKTPGVELVVFEWSPWKNVRATVGSLAALLNALLRAGPAHVVVIAHSAAGNLACFALALLDVPAGRALDLVTIGAPLAGMKGPPMSEDDATGSPMAMALMGTFRRYPRPPAGANVTLYVTRYPSDPVMQPRWGHQPAPADVGPPGATRIEVDPKEDHNHVVSKIVHEWIERVRRSKPLVHEQ